MSASFKKILLLCIVSLVLCLFSIQQGHRWGGDYSQYIAQADHLLDGTIDDFYSINHLTIDQSDEPIGPVLYPMGYPAAIAPVYVLFGLNFIALKIYNSLFFIACIPLIFLILKSISSKEDLAYYATALFALHYQMVFWSDSLGSDFLGMFLSYLAMYLMLRSRTKNSLINAFFIGVIIFLAFITRTAGLLLLPTFMLFQVVEFIRTKKLALVQALLPYLVFIIFTFIYGRIFENIDSKYLILVKNVTWQSIGGNVIGYGEILMEFLVSLKYVPTVLIAFFGVLFFPILGVGIANLITKKNLFLFGYCAAMLVLYIVYPFTTIRFILPLSAFVIYGFLNGLDHLSNRYFEKLDLMKWAGTGLVVLMIVQSLIVIVVKKKNGSNESLSPEMTTIYQYINENIDDDKIFVFHKPRVLRLFTDNNGFMLNDFSTPKLNQVDHLLVKKDSLEYSGFVNLKEWDQFRLMGRAQ